MPAVQQQLGQQPAGALIAHVTHREQVVRYHVELIRQRELGEPGHGRHRPTRELTSKGFTSYPSYDMKGSVTARREWRRRRREPVHRRFPQAATQPPHLAVQRISGGAHRAER